MHRKMKLALLGAWLATAAAHAQPLTSEQVEQQATQFARARGEDARMLLLGTPQPQAAAPGDLDCEQLYHRRVVLMQARLDPGPTDYFSDPRVAAGTFVGALWTPGFYYLPFRALQDFREQAHRPQQEAELDALRAASAAQRCFER